MIQEEEAAGSRIEYGYGSGYINGFMAETDICFEKGEAAPCLQNVTILQADQASGVSQDLFAGIIGLSPRSTEKNLKAFIQQVTEINQFSTEDQLQAQFSVFLSKSPKESGSITFGGYDLAQYAKAGLTEKDIFWADVSKQEHYWTVGLNEIALKDNKGAVTLSGIKGRYAIMDTGVSYSLVPGNDFLLLLDALQTGYNVHCQAPSGEQTMTTVYNC